MAAGALAGRRSSLLICSVAALTILARTVTGQIVSVDVTPSKLTVTPGKEVSILCRVGYTISYCRIKIGRGNFTLVREQKNDTDISYFGKGYQQGECGVTIHNVEEKHNGKFECSVSPPPSQDDEPKGNMNLTVAKAPEQPRLRLNARDSTSSYKAGDDLFASCEVRYGRPEARIRWLLGDEELSDGVTYPSLSFNPDDTVTVVQNLTRRVLPSDQNKALRCEAHHMALQKPLEVQRQLQIYFAPVPREDAIGIFGIKIGENGIINVTIQANPPPSVQWRVAGQVIRSGDTDSTGRIAASPPLPLGDGYYNASLTIASITKEDTEVDYILDARNQEGETNYRIIISTMEEPQGVDLGVGSIVGIVIGVLVLLIIVFMVIFAKATNRWCFGEGAGKPVKSRNAGESSDTESADAAHLSRAREESRQQTQAAPEEGRAKEGAVARVLSIPRNINFRKLLPGGAKNKDRVAQVEAQAEQLEAKVEEEKPLQTKVEESDTTPFGKNVVYAELSLRPTKEQPNVLRPPEEKTEYAEIVYGNQPLPNKNDSKK